MLVLTRKLSEQIRIGNDIIITVLEFRGSSIRLGIEAPRDVRVMREELPRREITINLESPEGLASINTLLNAEPTPSVDVQVIELDRKRSAWQSTDQVSADLTTKIDRQPKESAKLAKRSPLSSKLASRRAGNMPNTPASEATANDDGAGIRPENDLFGQDHLMAAQRSFSSAV